MEKLCLGCMQMKQNEPICEHCGYDERTENQSHQLPVGTILQNQYLVGRVLGQGGFGITYMGWDQNLSIPVAIKEYFPGNVVQRYTKLSTKVTCVNGEAPEVFEKHRDRFLKEARTLAQLSDIPEIVEIKSFFAENDTAYIVMEYVDGVTLKDNIKEKGRPLTEGEVLELMKPVLQALQKVHDKSLIHRDISPDNIMLPGKGGVKIIDFGTVRYMDDSGKSKSTEAVVKPGFAPMEQYNTHGDLGTWTDVYALCATFYYLLTGKKPEEAMYRLESGESLELLRSKPELSSDFVDVLEKGMRVRIPDRIQTVDELYRLLYCGQTLKKKTIKQKSRKGLLAAAAALILAAGAALVMTKPKEAPIVSEPVPETIQQLPELTAPEASQEGSMGMSDMEIRYSEAEALEQEGQYAQAAMAFGKLGNYRDAKERSFALWAELTDRETLIAQTFHTVGVQTDGTVLAAGRNDYGQCNVEDWNDIVAVSASGYHTVGLKSDGTVVATGINGHGQCDVESWTNIVAILAEGEPFTEQNGEIPIGYTVGLKSDGTLITTGANTYGQCDVSDWTEVVSLTSDNLQWDDVISVHLIGLRADGTVLMAGTNEDNWCAPVLQWTDIVSVSSCCQHIVGLRSDGTTVYAATPMESWAFHPGRYDASGWENVVQAVSASCHTIALRADGTVKAYGYDGHYDHSRVTRWRNIISLHANDSYTVGLKADGTVVGVGYDNVGMEKGFAHWRDIVAVYTSSIHVVGIRQDGTAVASGFNEYGQCEVSGWDNLIIPE